MSEIKHNHQAQDGTGNMLLTASILFANIDYSGLPDFVLKAAHMAEIAKAKFEQKQLENTSAFEPFYLKDFFTTAKA